MKDPKTRAEWQEAIDGAELLLHIDSARQYGLIETNMKINADRCAEVLEMGKERGIKPRPIDVLLKEFFGQCVKKPLEGVHIDKTKLKKGKE